MASSIFTAVERDPAFQEAFRQMGENLFGPEIEALVRAVAAKATDGVDIEAAKKALAAAIIAHGDRNP